MRSPHTPFRDILSTRETLHLLTEMMHTYAHAWVGMHSCGARSFKLSVQRGR